jgi:hypothetical protein
MFVRMAVLMAILLTALTGNVHAELKKGDTLVTRVNLHPDGNKRLLYSLNYQLQGFMIPVCTEITITKVKTKEITFDYNGIPYTLAWDGHTRKAGVSLMQVAEEFFGPECPEKEIAAMSELDQEGIRRGIPQVGMSREAILIAMGRPPFHANPSLEAPTFMYWANRYKRKAIDFDKDGKVVAVRL